MDARRLQKFFNFSENDLLANRRGQLSESQQKRLHQEARAEQASARSSAAILFVIAAFGLAIGLGVGSIAPASIGRALLIVSMGMLWPAVWAGNGLKILRAAYALRQPRLCQISGQAHIIRHADGGCVLKIGELEFDLEENPAGVLWEGETYTAYFVEATHEILSIEYFVAPTQYI